MDVISPLFLLNVKVKTMLLSWRIPSEFPKKFFFYIVISGGILTCHDWGKTGEVRKRGLVIIALEKPPG